MPREPWEQPEQPSGVPQDFWVVAAAWGQAYVSAEAAQAIEAALDQEPMPRWVTFRDLAGARSRIRPREIVCITERTAAQRAYVRAFNRARKAEEKAEKDWSADDA